MIFHASPFPTNSSTHFHTNCIKRINSEIKKVMMNGPRKDFRMSRFNFFINDPFLQFAKIVNNPDRVSVPCQGYFTFDHERINRFCYYLISLYYSQKNDVMYFIIKFFTIFVNCIKKKAQEFLIIKCLI